MIVSNRLADTTFLIFQVAVTAVCPEPAMYRGTWKPHMLIINQWSSATDYNTFYNSGMHPLSSFIAIYILLSKGNSPVLIQHRYYVVLRDIWRPL